MIPLVTAVRDLGRLREITTVLVRHGFGEVVMRARFVKKKGDPGSALTPDMPELTEEDAKTGEDEKKRVSTYERIRLVLEELGPSFIKLGQIASTRTDVLPVELTRELRKLQDSVPPTPGEEIKRAVEASLGGTIESIFETFDLNPLATASIGQVHRATIKDEAGAIHDVVVKVQRPGVATTVQRDLEILHMMAAGLERAVPETRIYSPVGLVQQFDRSITAEMNFSLEAENAARFTQNFADDPNIRFPKVYKNASSKHVLTIEYFDGRKIDVAIREGANGKLVAKRAVAFVVKMIFDDGFFHADPHPGNIILMGPNEEPVIGLIDLGMVGRLSPELRDRTIDLMVAAVRKDGDSIADALYAIGRPTKKIDQRAFRAEVAVLAEKYLGRPMKEVELSALIRDIVSSAMKYGIEIPPDFMLVGKALMTLEGIGKELDPDLDLTTEAAPYFLALLKRRYSPERLGNDIFRGAMQLSRASYDMPLQIREVLDDVRLGRLTFKTEDPLGARAADQAGRRVFSGVVFGSLAFSTAYLVAQKQWIGAGIFGFFAIGAWMRDFVFGGRR